jgi:phosphatidylinositol 4-kinase
VRQIYRNGEPGTDSSDDLFTYKLLDQNAALYCPSTDTLEGFIAQLEDNDYTVGHIHTADIRDILRKTATLVCSSGRNHGTLIRHLVGLPFAVFTKKAIKVGMLLWTGVMNEKPEFSTRMLSEIARNFEITVEKRMGLFAGGFTIEDAFEVKMEYAPSSKEKHNLEQHTALELLSPHLRLLQLLSSHFHANRHGNLQVQRIFIRLMRVALKGLKTATGHPLAREARFQLVHLGLQVLRYSIGLTESQQQTMKDLILSAGLSWFKFQPRWSFGGNRLQVKAEAHLLQDVANLLNSIAMIGGQSKSLILKQDLLLLLLENEQYRLATWLYPLEHSRRHHLLPSYSAKPPTDNTISVVLPAAWQEDPAIAVQLTHRFQSERLQQDVRRLVLTYPEKVMHIPDAAQIMLGGKLAEDISFQLRYLLYWSPVNPVTATTYFLPGYSNDPFILQYALRSLESFSVDVTFFYVPQIVQTLRYDALGYVERFILETAKFSQLFAHQIIWNIKANAYKDEEALIPDPVKPTLDHVMSRLVDNFSGEDKSFYEREFNFFGEVTAISGKLRPYIRKTKPEKNQKIAEELAKIKVDVGVYLPSNPDSVVIDIDRNSGKSLQSHAKAPFMATFKIRRKAAASLSEHDVLDRHGRRHESTSTVTKEMMQAAIFKVGDDCRQDMLALQLIAAFRSIFNSVGLDVFVFPYRVTATAPGCGVIDVLPKSISRDMLGRDYDMGLYDYFISRYGGEDSIRFQEARNCFVKSMAAYSVISYLLKFKDRHNGNIMIDDAGHIIHIGT